MDLNKIICNNCFKAGHFYKNCDKPLTSYGICCYKKIEDNYFFLMVLRRNTYTYIEFIRGIYDLLNIDYLKILFEKMTNTEKENIMKYDFKYLWNKLWLIDDLKTKINNKNEFYKGIIKFNILKNGFYNNNHFYDLKYFINNSNSKFNNSEWFFPKGKKNINETNIDAAKREFFEETNIEINKINVFENKRFEEIHTGSNGKKYKTIFYLSEYINDDYKTITNNFDNNKTTNQMMEIKDIKWIELDKLKSFFRNYENSKVDLIQKIKSHIISE